LISPGAATEGYPGPRNSSNQIGVPILIKLPENICQTNEKISKLAKFEEKNRFRFSAHF
jgi:hypothetical protein